MRFSLFPLAIVLICSSFFVQAKMYKWVDDEGQMHFGDKIPLKYQSKEHDVLNERGMTAKHREAAKSSEQIAEEKRLDEERQKSVLAAEKKKKLDRVLLDAYDSEQDLMAARDSRLEDVAFQIQLAESSISALNKKIRAIEVHIADIKAENREAPNNLYNNINSEKQQLAVQKRVIASNKKRRAEIIEKYKDYIERFRAAQLH